MRVDKGQLPPVKAFWSLTMYDGDFFFVPNPINRYDLGQRNKFVTNSDGSVDLYLQADSPGKEREAKLAPGAEGEVHALHAALLADRASAVDPGRHLEASAVRVAP